MKAWIRSFINKEPMPWEYRAKPVWKRMVVITAGVIMNIILAFLIFYVINIAKGKTLSETTTVGYVAPNTPAQVAGLQQGDKILAINTTAVNYWEDINGSFINHMGEPLVVKINRGGRDTSISVSKEVLGDLTEHPFGIYQDKVQPVVTMVTPDKPASTIGLKENDEITEFGGTTIHNSQQLIDVIQF